MSALDRVMGLMRFVASVLGILLIAGGVVLLWLSVPHFRLVSMPVYFMVSGVVLVLLGGAGGRTTEN